MDVLLDCYFEQAFADIERSALQLRYKRKEVVDYVNTLISGCSAGGDFTTEEMCRQAVLSILRFHSKQKQENGNICQMGKYHNILYIAMKLSFDWSLADTEVVANLLDELYACEKSFERIMLGAAYGQNAPFFVVGWRSDFGDRKENMKAVTYFLEHATAANLEYKYRNKSLRFIDIPTDSFSGHTSTVNVAAYTQVPDLLLTLLRFGARFQVTNKTDEKKDANLVEISPIDFLLMKLIQMNAEQLKAAETTTVFCLKLILRAVVSITLKHPSEYKLVNNTNSLDDGFPEKIPIGAQWETLSDGMRVILMQGSVDEIETFCSLDEIYRSYQLLIDQKIIPKHRCGFAPPELKHLTRCKIRHALWKNYQLPMGIKCLSVPHDLQQYLDLQAD